MELDGKVVAITGAGSGLGREMARRFQREGARVALADIEAATLEDVAAELGAPAQVVDVAREADIEAFVTETEAQLGPIDLFCSNAGIAIEGDPWTSDEEWDRIWAVNVKSHIYAARHVLPGMLERGSGYLLQTASAAGLATQLGSAPYAVTKHAVVAFAEWLAITYGERGIRVTVLAPQAVRTRMTEGIQGSALSVAAVDGMIEPEEAIDVVVAALEEERFLALPHPEVLTYLQRKAGDYDRWIRGMQRLQRELLG